MDLGLTGAKAVISGGTQGIGLAVAKELLNEGASVGICARRQDGVDTALEELSALGTAVGQVCDVSDHAATVQWMRDAAEALGGIDIVVHNATASGQPGPGPQSWINNFNVDLLGMVGMSEGALPYLEQSERAALVQIATITGIEHHDVPISPSYGAIKAASIRHMAQLAPAMGLQGHSSQQRLARADLHRRRCVEPDKGQYDRLIRAGPRLSSHQAHGNRGRGRKGRGFPGQSGGKLGERHQRACGRGFHAGRELLIAGGSARVWRLPRNAPRGIFDNTRLRREWPGYPRDGAFLNRRRTRRHACPASRAHSG